MADIFVACIIGAHGLGGFVRVKSFAAVPQNLAKYKYLYDEAGKAYEVEQCQLAAKSLLIKFKDINNRTEAEALKSIKLYIKPEQLPDLKKDEFYHKDLIGLVVKDVSENIYGKIIAIYNFGAGEVLDIEAVKNASFMLPFETKYVPVVNIEQGHIIISPEAFSFIDVK